MATYNTPLITTQGLALLKAEIAGNDSVTFTKIVFSSDDYSQTADSAVQALTGLSNLDLTAPAKSFTDVNGNLKIRAVGNNENTSSAFYIKTYGLYGTNKAGNELLIAVATTQNANFVPAYNGKQTNQIAYTFNIAISSTNNITLSSSTDVGVTQADLAGINNYVNSNASSASSAIASNASSINSVQSSVTANSSAIASNASSISNLQSNLNNVQSSVNNLSGRQPLPVSKPQDFPSGKFVAAGNPTQWDMPDLTAWLWLVDVEYASGLGLFVKKITASNSSVGDFARVISVAGLDTGWYRPATSNDVNQINANITNVQNQVNSVNSNALMFKGDIPAGTQLSSITASGIYHLPNNNYPDAPSIFDSYSSGAQFIVINYGGFISQKMLISTQLSSNEVTRLLGGSSNGNWQATSKNNV